MDYFGIDPGKRGAIARLRDDGSLRGVWLMPARADGWVDIRAVASLLFRDAPVGSAHYALEAIETRPKQGIASTARAHRDWGKIAGALEMHGVEVGLRHYPRSQAWKALLSAPRDKAAAIALALELHPEAVLIPPGGRKPHDGMGDAIIIAHWCRRVHGAYIPTNPAEGG